jgi:hypothetical protein
MKKLRLLIIVAGAMLILACNAKTDSAVSGVYVTAFKNEYTIANDTLIIEAYNLETGTYKIERHSGFKRIRDRKVLPTEYKRENWTATFDKDKQVLQETQLGKQLYVNTHKGTLSFGATYQKIK